MTDDPRLARYLLSAARGEWQDVPQDRQPALVAQLRAALTAAPVAGRERRLSETGAVLISLRALDEYIRQTQPAARKPEYARAQRELTEMVLDAHRIATRDRPEAERWRTRSRSAGIDLTVSVQRQGRLAIVTSIGRVRRRAPGAGRQVGANDHE